VGRLTERAVPSLKPLTRTQLVAGGVSGMDPDVVHGYRAMAALGVPALLILEGVLTSNLSAIWILLIIVVGPLIWALPASTIRRRAQARLDLIDRALPELVDVITATIDAGLGFAAALQLVADRFDGPLGEELRLTLHEQNMGLATDRALVNMLERCETPSVRAFVRAVEQGSTLGISVGGMMRSVAMECRSRRREAAHEKVQKAPVKLLFPLVLLIFPSLMIVILYPALHVLLHALAGGG
jgi:tight adherence protein C